MAAGIAMIIMVLLTVMVFQLTKTVTNYADRRGSESYLEILRDIQSYYASDVLKPMRENGIQPVIDYRNTPLSAPYPATFTHELVTNLSATNESRTFRFFSKLPFVKRPDSGPQDDFETMALQQFEDDPTLLTMNREEASEQGQRMRIAVAMRMDQGCVDCHNSHPESPKTDWQVGELRGVMAVSRPVSAMSTIATSRMAGWIFALWIILAALVVSLVGGVAVVSRNNRELILAKRDIEQLAAIDSVCEIANRRSFFDYVDRLFADGSQTFNMITLDLRGFKAINDIHGHAIGDHLLFAVGRRLVALCPQKGLVARLGGDEFAIAIPGDSLAKPIVNFVQTLVQTLSEPYSISGRTLHVTSAAGIATAPIHSTDTAGLLACADLAMYHARGLSSTPVCMFDDSLRDEAIAADAMAIELREAISSGQFSLHYQPQFTLASGKLSGLEALVRWEHPQRGRQMPGVFLPVIQQFSLSLPLSVVIIDLAIRDLQGWMNAGLSVPDLSINIHPDQLRDVGHIAWLRGRLAASGISPKNIILEITEECVLGRGGENSSLILEELRGDGFRISLDDFGTGYASLSHVKTLPVDELKIDRSFVRNIVDDETDRTIVAGLIALSKSLKIDLVAEGIEDVAQAAALTKLGCPKVQGYLFGRPQSVDDITSLLGSTPKRQRMMASA